MHGCEGFSGKVRYPVTELLMLHHDEAKRFAVKGMADSEGGVAAITYFGYVWGI